MFLSKSVYLRWAQAALSQYPPGEYSLHFLGHSDNLTFRVDEAGGAAYLLRLHYPAAETYQGPRQTPDVIAGELAWLEALFAEGGFDVQRPVRTAKGGLIGSTAVDTDKTVPVTLLTWLDGVHFGPSAPDTAALIGRFGELVARLHDFSSRWSSPCTRPSYDSAYFRRILARLLRGADLGIFSEGVFRILRTAAQTILDEIGALPVDPQHWGMIHADLHVGNFLVRGETISPIDFSFCGYGHYLFDLSIPLAGGLRAELRPHFLSGYRRLRSLPESSLRAVEAYALAGRLSYYAHQIDNPTEQAWLKARIPRVAETICQRFIRGEPVLDDM